MCHLLCSRQIIAGIAQKREQRFKKNGKGRDRATLRFLTANKSPAHNLRKRERKRERKGGNGRRER